jgi:L-lactate utilization protein LutC
MAFVLPDPGPPNLEFAQPADAERLEHTKLALIARGFDAEIANDAEHAKQLVLGALPEGAQVHSALSETLRELGITQAIDESGRYDSVRQRLKAMDKQTQGRDMRKLGAAPDYIIGSAHAITADGTILVGSGTGSQLAGYAYAAGNVILVVGHQKLVRDLTQARRRLVEYCLPREFERMQSLGRAGSVLGKTLTLEREFGGRTRVILVPASLGF